MVKNIKSVFRYNSSLRVFFLLLLIQDLELGVHGVRPEAGRQLVAAASQTRRHRHGPRATDGRPQRQDLQLRHRPLLAALQSHRKTDASAKLLRIVRQKGRHGLPDFGGSLSDVVRLSVRRNVSGKFAEAEASLEEDDQDCQTGVLELQKRQVKR